MADMRTSNHPGLARVIEKQMRNWEIARAQRLERSAAPPEEVVEFLTIANIVGAGGKEAASTVSEKLGWPLFDRQILTAMAGDDELRGRLYESMDERDLGWFENVFRSMMEEEFRKNDYFHRLTETVLFIARQGPAIFVGRSADLILPKNRGLRVKIIASLDRCVANFADRNGVTIEQARSEVARIENGRRDFIRHHFHIDGHDPTRFDLLLNVERLTTSQAVGIILAAMKLRDIRV